MQVTTLTPTRSAACGIGTLVAGKVAEKAAFLKNFGVIVVAAAAVMFRKVYRSKPAW